LFGREFRRKRSSFRKRTRVHGDAVSLYSGGLDSLIGVINWLEENPTASIVLASTYDAQAEGSHADQERLLPHLETEYDGRIQRYVARTGLCVGGEDTNFRSRSLAFIGNAVLAASFLGDDTSIVIPENGAIALNYPLTPARRGSLSTRTVHPHFIAMLSILLGTLGLRYPLNNPYFLKTKGEMMQECRNASLLRASYADSASCGKRGYSRVYWEDRHARQCGVCVPCIFRRAAIHSVGLPAEQYGNDLTPSRLMQIIQSQHNHDLSAIIDFIERNDNSDTIWWTLRSNGRLDSSLKDQYTSLIERLRDEVKSWVQSIGPL
jgi:7-cyano-7-deazaguanine synthase in queuosine biosynthesis